MEAAFVKEYMGNYANCFAIIGLAATTYVASKLCMSLWGGIKAFLLARALGLSADLKRMGDWAVVTGATDGIGKAYARALAKKGMKVCLISRTPEKLQDVAAEIEKEFSVETKTIAVDFTGKREDIYGRVRQELKGMDIGVLVNNVGLSYKFPEYYTSVDEQTIANVVTCNIDSITYMSHIVLPGMLEKKKGVILNLSSASAARPTPMLAVYSATKAYVDTFSQALQTEYRSKGIIIQSVLPFFVATKMSRIRKATFFVPSPSGYVQAALGTVGVQERTFGCLPHAIQGCVVDSVPKMLYDQVSMNLHIALRKKALKKLEAKKE